MTDDPPKKVFELLAHKGPTALSMATSMLTGGPDMSMLDMIDREVGVTLKARAERREKFRTIGHEPPPLDDGVEERALLIRQLVSSARDHIRQNQAADAAEKAALAAYYMCELGMLIMDEDDREAVWELIRGAARGE